MPIELLRSELLSRTIRSAATNNNLIREIDLANGILEETDDEGGFLRRVFNVGARVIGGLIKFGEFLFGKLNFTSVFAWLVNSYYMLVNFDWNATDEEIRQRVDGGRLGLLGLLGDATGQAFGWTTAIGIGYGVSLVLPVIGSSALAKFVTARVLDEAVEEIFFNFAAVIRQAFAYLGSYAISEAYIGIRKLIKSTVSTPIGKVVIDGIFGEGASKWVSEQWGTENAPILTIANEIDERLEKLPLGIRLFTEGFFDGFQDGFIEGGFIIAASLDDYVAQQKQQRKLNEKVVVVRPDETQPREQHIVQGTKEEIIAQTQQIITNHRIIKAKDVGEIVATPLNEIVNSGWSRYTLIIHYRDQPRPPYYDSKRSYIRVPHSRIGLTFEELKAHFKQYTWGSRLGGVVLEDGRQIVSYGVSNAEVKEQINAALFFCEKDVQRWLNFSDGSEQSLDRRKQPRVMYPWKAILVTKVRNPTSGEVVENKEVMYLYDDQPLYGVDRLIGTLVEANP